METRANSDVIDVLGFLACEVVSKITETALAIKNQWDNKYRSEQHKLTASAATFSGYLFQKPDDIRTPLRPEHIREAFRSLQKPQGVQIMGKRKHLYRAILL